MDELNFNNGLLGVGEQQTDFLLLNGNNLPKLYDQDNEIYEYNQGNTNDCTIYSAFGAVSDLMNYKFTKEEIADINELSYSRGRIRGEGRYILSAVKCVADRWNSHHKELGKVAYYRVELSDDALVDEILDKGYTLCSGYKGNYKYNTDFTMDDRLDGSEFGEKSYGHAVSRRKVDGVRSIKDNYAGRKYKGMETNIYSVVPSCSKLVEDKTYYALAYVYTKVAEDNYEAIKDLEKFKTRVNIAIENNSAMRHITNSKEFKDKLHTRNNSLRAKLVDIQNEINKLM